MLWMLCGLMVGLPMKKIRTYSDLIQLKTFNERYKYLCLNGFVGEKTFGVERYLNQILYKSKEWKKVRDFVIIRDNGCDLAMPDYEIFNKIYIHHMNPISVDDVINLNKDILFNPEYLITVSFNTHQAIHYGNDNILPTLPGERKKGDTCLWR